MLNWLAGQKHADGPQDPDATGYIEPPETPAPVFAVRAFKHAIFGTPQTTQPKPRRHSNTESGRPRNIDARPSRPGISRPKSSNDTYTVLRQEGQVGEEPPTSPTKGILLSPGTATARKKNVTFGENVVDNEDKRAFRSALPDECAAKSSEAWAIGPEDPKRRDASPDKSRSRTTLVEALEQARDESKKRKLHKDRPAELDAADEQLSNDLANPQSQSGKYWKHEYDIYRTNTQREVKKLITKQKAAKSFAMMKDTQCTELADQLRQEQKKVERLELRTAELTSLIERLRDELRASQDTANVPQKYGGNLRPSRGYEDGEDHPTVQPKAVGSRQESEARDRRDRTKASKHVTTRSADSHPVSTKPVDTQADVVQKPSEPYNPSVLSYGANSDTLKPGISSKVAQDDVEVDGVDDLWAQPFDSSSPLVSRAADKPVASRSTRLRSFDERNDNALQSLDLNLLSAPTSLHGRPSQSADIKRKSARQSEKGVDIEPSNHGQDSISESLHESDVPPVIPSQPSLYTNSSQAQKSFAKGEFRPDQDADRAHLSDPFQAEVPEEPRRTAAVRSNNETKAKPATSYNTKENIPPKSESKPSHIESSAKPSILWSAMNAPKPGQRDLNLTGKDGKELSSDRIEAARARIAARARGTSGG